MQEKIDFSDSLRVTLIVCYVTLCLVSSSRYSSSLLCLPFVSVCLCLWLPSSQEPSASAPLE